jgi:hypothetical protein
MHRHRHASAVGEAVDLQRLHRTAVGRLVGHGDLARARDLHFGGAVDVAIGVTPDNDRLRPVRHQARHVLANDRFAENRAVQNVAQRAVRAAIHALEAEFGDPRLIRRDRGTLYADTVLGDRIGRIDRHLVIGLIAIFDAEVIVFQIDVQIRKDQFFLDESPNNAGHLVPVQLYNRGLDLDFCHHILTGGTSRAGFPASKTGRTIAPHANQGKRL